MNNLLNNTLNESQTSLFNRKESGYSELNQLMFKKTDTEIELLNGQRIREKDREDGFGLYGKQRFGTRHEFLKSLTECVNYTIDNDIRNRHDK